MSICRESITDPAKHPSRRQEHPLHPCCAMLAFFLFCFFSAITLAACEPPPHISREDFDQAEIAYKSGQYDKATELYNRFLKSSPDPQLARLAERRVLSIEREFESIRDKKNGPRPIYLINESSSTPTKQSHIFTIRDQQQSSE